MNFRLAARTTLIIGTLVAIVGVLPTPRNAIVSAIRGEIGFSDLVKSVFRKKQTDGEDRATPPRGVAEPAARQDPQGGPDDRQAESLLDRAVATLEGRPSIAAKIRQSVDLFGKRLVGAGEYLEQRAGSNRMFRLELRVQIGDEPRTMLQVCDGRYYWRCESYRGKGTAERVDLARAAQMRDGENSLELGRMGPWSGVGGLPKLVRNLRNWFRFVAVHQTTLPDRTPVICLRGEWKPDRLAAIVPSLKASLASGAPVDFEKLPEQLPHVVLVYLGQDDLFPFRIEYRRRLLQPSHRPDGQSEVPIVTVDLFEVSFRVPVNPSRFAFSPGNLEYSDQTERFAERLGLKKNP